MSTASASTDQELVACVNWSSSAIGGSWQAVPIMWNKNAPVRTCQPLDTPAISLGRGGSQDRHQSSP